MRVKSNVDVHNVLTNIEQTRKVSDKLIGFGPWGFGLDGALTLLPGIGELYTLGAGAYLLAQGAKARVSGIVLWQVGALIAVDFALGAVPGPGDAMDILFCAHLWAGWLLRRAIQQTAFIGDDDDQAPPPAVQDAMQAGKRIVFLPKTS